MIRAGVRAEGVRPAGRPGDAARAAARAIERKLIPAAENTLRRELWRGGNRELRNFKKTLPSKFKSGGRKVGPAMRIYTKDTPQGPRLGVFTRWKAAEVVEAGGVIRPVKGQWLVIPVAPWLMTPTGAVRRQHRDPKTGSFDKALFEDTVPIRRGSGLIVLLGSPPTVKRRQKLASGRRSRTKGKYRIGPALQPVFLLVREVRKDAVLGFFEFWTGAQVIDAPAMERVARAVRRSVNAKELA